MPSLPFWGRDLASMFSTISLIARVLRYLLMPPYSKITGNVQDNSITMSGRLRTHPQIPFHFVGCSVSIAADVF